MAGGQSQLLAQEPYHQPSQPVAQSRGAELAQQLPSGASNSPTPLFPQPNAPPSLQARPPQAHPTQPHPPSQLQQYGSPVPQHKSPLLGSQSPSTSLGVSPRDSTGTPSESLLGQSPIPDLVKPRALLNTPQAKVDSSPLPPKITTSLESNRFEPRGSSFRPLFPPHGGNSDRERNLNLQGRETGLSGHTRQRAPVEEKSGSGQAGFNLWEETQRQQEQTGGGEYPSSTKPSAEEVIAKQKRDQEENLGQPRQPPYSEHLGLSEDRAEFQRHHLRQESEYERRWPGGEDRRHDDFAHDHFKHGPPETEWGAYDSEHNGPGGRGGMHASSGQQFPYENEYEYSERPPGAGSLKSNEPTISSLRKDIMTTIPGLGGGFEDQEKERPKSTELSSNLSETKQGSQDVSGGGGAGGEGQDGENAGGTQSNHMIQSLGKLVSQLQTLKGLTSSLQLLHALPKGEGDREEAKAAQETVKPKERSESELSEETKRKVAALLATESDSDGEQVLHTTIGGRGRKFIFQDLSVDYNTIICTVPKLFDIVSMLTFFFFPFRVRVTFLEVQSQDQCTTTISHPHMMCKPESLMERMT